MRKHSFVVSSMTILALVLAMAVAAMAADPAEGTWKLNVAKSKFPLSQQATPKEQTVVYRELKKLDVPVGTWKFEGEVKQSPFGPGGKVSGTERFEWMPGGFFLQMNRDAKGRSRIKK